MCVCALLCVAGAVACLWQNASSLLLGPAACCRCECSSLTLLITSSSVASLCRLRLCACVWFSCDGLSVLWDSQLTKRLLSVPLLCSVSIIILRSDTRSLHADMLPTFPVKA